MMTPNELEALQRDYLAMSRQIDDWWLKFGSNRNKGGIEAMLAMIAARDTAKNLLHALHEEFSAHHFAVITYLEVNKAIATDDFPVIH